MDTNLTNSSRLESLVFQFERKLNLLELENKLLKGENKLLREEHEYICRLISRRRRRVVSGRQ